MTQLSFAEWLETPLGAEVYHRITHNRHAVPLSQYIARWQTIEDTHGGSFAAFSRLCRPPKRAGGTHLPHAEVRAARLFQNPRLRQR
jgi:hypothetical protein